MKVTNSQIARAIFYKLHRSHSFVAASRVASGIFDGSLYLGFDLEDITIKSELEMFGCKLVEDDNPHSVRLRMFDNTDIPTGDWYRLVDDIYNNPKLMLK